MRDGPEDYYAPELADEFDRDPDCWRPSDASAILAAVARLMGVDPRSQRRTQHVSWARQVAMYLIRTHTDMSYPAIGRLFPKPTGTGHVDHSTVIHGVNKVTERCADNPQQRRVMNEIMRQVKR